MHSADERLLVQLFYYSSEPRRPLSLGSETRKPGGARLPPIGQGSPTVGTWEVALDDCLLGPLWTMDAQKCPEKENF